MYRNFGRAAHVSNNILVFDICTYKRNDKVEIIFKVKYFIIFDALFIKMYSKFETVVRDCDE